MAILAGTDKIGQVVNGYKISILIEDDHGDVWDYEPDTKAIRIVSSFKSKYPIFIIKLDLKPKEVIENSILGHKIIELNIDFVEDNSPSMIEPFNLKLLYLSGDFDFPISNTLLSNVDSMQDQVPYTIRAVPLYPFSAMTSTVNKIYKNITPLDCLHDLFDEATTSLDTHNDIRFASDTGYYSCKFNESVIDQIIFPPTILGNHIDYLFDEYGIFPGYGVFYTNLQDNNTFYATAMSLNHRLYNDYPEVSFTIVQLANDVDNRGFVDDLNESILKNKYYTYFGIHTNYIGNTSFANNGFNLFYVNKPVDRFCRVDGQHPNFTTIDPYDAFKDFSEPPELYAADAIMMNREMYNTSHICYNRDEKNANKHQDEDWLHAQLSKSILNLTQIKIKLERNLPLHKFTNIGQSVNFESQTNEYTILNGKYLLFNTDIVLTRKSEWQCTCDLTLIRPKWDV